METRFRNATDFPETHSRFWERINGLRAAATEPEPYDERARELIRGEAVNCFVSVEEVFDSALSFVTWALLSDHWGKATLDRFVYAIEDARAFTATRLGGTPTE